MAYRKTREPRTKEELLDRLVAQDYPGDLRSLAESVAIERTAANIVKLTFPNTGTYELTIHKRHANSNVKAPAQYETEPAPEEKEPTLAPVEEHRRERFRRRRAA